MLHLTFRRVVDEHRLRAWMSSLQQRADEVRQTFRQEGVRHEQAFLLRDANGLVLVYAHEVDDPEAAHAAYAASTLPIDLQHREQMSAALGGEAEAELLYDVRL
jgi:Family of unknown function (DUF6176)